MKEIEAKFKINDLEAILNRLSEIGANYVHKRSQIDTYYVHSKTADLVNVPTYLRVRTSNNKSYVSFHYKLEKYIWQELETVVENGETLRQIFTHLNFSLDVEVAKERHVYNYDGAEIVIDDVAKLGVFMEIEAQSYEQLLDLCLKTGFELNVNSDPLEGKSYADLIREHSTNL